MDQRVADLQQACPELFSLKGGNLDDLDDHLVLIASPAAVGPFRLGDTLDRVEAPLSHREDEIPDVLEALADPDLFGERASVDALRWVLEVLGKTLGHGWAGGIVPADPKATISPDSLAFYLPFHYFPSSWGIYLLGPGIAHLAGTLRKDLPWISKLDSLKVARAFLFHHEAYHSAVEGFATRVELVTTEPLYKGALQDRFDRNPPLSPHEETLACVYAMKMVRQNVKGSAKDEICYALQRYLAGCGPRYSPASNICEAELEFIQRQFAEDVIRSANPKRASISAEAWALGQFMFRTLLQRNKHYSWILPRRDFEKMSRLSVHYFRNGKVVRCLKRLIGVEEVKAGYHNSRLVRTDGKGQAGLQTGEIPLGTLGGMLKQLNTGLSIAEFRERCRDIGCSIS